jgi:hypothetical protein
MTAVPDRRVSSVQIHRDAVDRMAAPYEFLAREQAFFHSFLRRMGVPERTVDKVALPDPYADYREPVETDRVLIGGDTGNHCSAGFHLHAASDAEVVHVWVRDQDPVDVGDGQATVA